MKIGILTHHYISNFGAFLQAYALQQAIQTEFPNDEVQIIDYYNLKHFVINNGGWFRFYKDRENLNSWLQKIRLPYTFHKARKEFLKTSSTCYTVHKINRLQFDCIVIGSDEVWNYKEKKGNAKVKFGIGLDCKKLVAYAPSVGKSGVDSSLPEYIKEGLLKFSSISARDEYTVEFVKRITGNDPYKVLDPTFLAHFPSVLNKRKGSKPYILFYYCEKLPSHIKEEIIAYAQKNAFALYGAGECDKIYDEITVNLTPFEWIQMFKEAEFVFTGTFHGAVFSILNNKNFACYLTNPSRIKKVSALLAELGIAGRIIENDSHIEDLLNNKVDYSNVNNIIEEKKEASLQFLHDAIKQ